MSAYSSSVRFVYDKYVFSATARCQERVTVPVFEVWRGLDGAFSLAEIHDVLASKKFADALLLALLPGKRIVWEVPTEYTFGLLLRRPRAQHVDTA